MAATNTSAAQAQVQRSAVKLNGSGLSVPAYTWADPETTPQALVLAVHGGVQHAGVYNAMARSLAEHGFLVYSIDLRGHGQWLVDSKRRPKLDYNASTEDVIAIAQQLRQEHPGLPLFSMGESLGASISLHAITRDPKLFDGMIMASPGTSLHVGKGMVSVFPSIWQGASTLGRSIDLSPHLKRISEDERSSQETIHDPRNRTQASVGDLLHAARFVRGNESLAGKINPSVPILVLQGTVDEICSAKSVKHLFTKFPSQDKQMKTFDGCGHLVITTEYIKPVVTDTVVSWLDAHTKLLEASARPEAPSPKTKGQRSKS